MAARKRRGSVATESAPSPLSEPSSVAIPAEVPIPELPVDPDEPSPLGDILSIDPNRMRAMAAKGTDTVVARVRVERFSEKEGRFIRLDGEFPPDVVTARWIRKRFGAGRYFCRGHNVNGQYLASGHVVVEAEPELPQPVVAPTMPSVAGGPLTFEQQLVLALIGNRAAPQQQDDGLRETLAAMSKMIALQVQTATMNQVKSGLGGGQQNGHSEDRFFALLSKLVEQPAKRDSGGFGLKEFLPVLQLGIGLGQRASGIPVKENPKDLPPWLQVVPDLADTIGVPLIVTIAQATLPPEKAQAVIDTVNEHQKARQAEAAAAVAEEGNDDE